MTFTSMPIPPDPIGPSRETPIDQYLQVSGYDGAEAKGSTGSFDDSATLFKDVMVTQEEDDWLLHYDENREDKRRRKNQEEDEE